MLNYTKKSLHFALRIQIEVNFRLRFPSLKPLGYLTAVTT